MPPTGCPALLTTIVGGFPFLVVAVSLVLPLPPLPRMMKSTTAAPSRTAASVARARFDCMGFCSFARSVRQCAHQVGRPLGTAGLNEPEQAGGAARCRMRVG